MSADQTKTRWGILTGAIASDGNASYKFGVTKEGLLYARAGRIAGWQINDGYLTSGTAGKNDIIGLSTKSGGGSQTYAFVAGSNSHTS